MSRQKDAGRNRRMKMKMIQNVLLIWLDDGIDENNVDCRGTISQLRRSMNTIKTFTDTQQCVEFIKEINDEKVCLDISNSLAENSIPHLHDMIQVDSILIHSRNAENNDEWIKLWPKIKGVFSDIEQICDTLKELANECEQNAIGFSIMNISDDLSQKNLNQLDPMFMYSQIIEEVLLTIKFGRRHILEFTEYCREILEKDNQKELENVRKFELEYGPKTPIWWYTFESFLYPMLNRALRLTDIDIIIKMGFFIGDLHRQIAGLHKQQYVNKNTRAIFTVYRGQGMSKEEFEQVANSKGGLISFNNFLSTSIQDTVSTKFARRALQNINLVGIIFVMNIDSSQSTAPFASVENFGAYKDGESEILFSMHTVFRIIDVKPMDEDPRLYRVELTLTQNTDKDMCVLSNRIREETSTNYGSWYRLGELLLKLGKSDKAEQVYQNLLSQMIGKKEIKAHLYNQLGLCKFGQYEYEEAIEYYQQCIEIYKANSSSDFDLAKTYNNLGLCCERITEYSKALLCYETTLKIIKRSLPSNHPDLAKPYHDIGSVYHKMGEYDKAIISLEKALTIRKASLPSNHPALASSYINIGSVFKSKRDYTKALSYYEKALEINRKSLPANHPDLAAVYGYIGYVYIDMVDYPKALSYFQKELDMNEHSSTEKHLGLAKSYINHGLLYDLQSDYINALQFYEKAVKIQQQLLHANHPDTATCHHNIGLIHYKRNEYTKAFLSYQKALTIQSQSLHSNHPDLAMSYMNIGNVFKSTDTYTEALWYYQKALTIQQNLHPNNYSIQGSLYTNMGKMHEKLHEYSIALTFFQEAHQIYENHPPSEHLILATSFTNVGSMYMILNEYTKALPHYEKALGINLQSLPSDHPDLLSIYLNMGKISKDLNKHSEILLYYEKVLIIQEKLLSSTDIQLAFSYNVIGEMCFHMDNH